MPVDFCHNVAPKFASHLTPHIEEYRLDQDNIELKVWKDLAVSKQILMRSASDALGLAPDCSAEELKAAMDLAVKRGNEADTAISQAQREASEQVSAIQAELKSTRKALAEAEGKIDGAEAGRANAEQRVVSAREANVKELKELKEQLAEKQRLIKATNIALADTPENVIKKLKKLKKEKLDEANACKRAETQVRSLKKDKKKLEETIEENKSSVEKSIQLATQHRELYELCKSQREQLESLIEDASTLAELPVLDEHLLEGIEENDDEKAKTDKAA